jgi:flagellar protein FliS
MYARAASAYKRVDLESASKPQILDQLFGRLLADLDAARKAIAARDIKAKAQAIDHALQIFGHLRVALDHARSPELCANLEALYQYAVNCVTRASAKLDPKPLDEVTTIVTQLRQGFSEAAVRSADAPAAARP